MPSSTSTKTNISTGGTVKNWATDPSPLRYGPTTSIHYETYANRTCRYASVRAYYSKRYAATS
eukprot:scaffold209401_cov15-Prasinocladus_malaysianus.AAC.1